MSGKKAGARREPYDARTDPDVPKGMSIELLQDLHLLTRDGQLNADARRKLKQIRHLVQLLKPALDDALARNTSPTVVDCGAGKSYLGALLYELVLGPAGAGTLVAIEARPELAAAAAARAERFAQQRFTVVTGAIAKAQLATPPTVVTALHACDTATDDALALAITSRADHVAVVPCCQAEVARQLEHAHPSDPAVGALFAHPLHRRELGSHLTNVVRSLVLAAHGYRVTVTELVGWEHSAKNELILAKRTETGSDDQLASRPHVRRARAELRALLDKFAISPALVSTLIERGLDPRGPAASPS